MSTYCTKMQTKIIQLPYVFMSKGTIAGFIIIALTIASVVFFK